MQEESRYKLQGDQKIRKDVDIIPDLPLLLDHRMKY
jgi:hypothetical protein